MDRMVGISIKKLDNMIVREIMKETKDNSELVLSPIQVRILKYLLNNKNKEVFQRDFEDRFEIRRSTTSGILNTMEKNNLIKREMSLLDQRQKKIIITDYGESVASNIKSNMNNFEKKLVNGIDKDELDIFFKVIDKIKNNLEGE